MRRPREALTLPSSSVFQMEERLVFEREISGGISDYFANGGVCITGLSHSFYPFTAIALWAGGAPHSPDDVRLPLLLLALKTDGAFMTAHEANLFGGTSVAGCRYAQLTLRCFGASCPAVRPHRDTRCIQLVVSFLNAAWASTNDDGGKQFATISSELEEFRGPVPLHIVQLLLSVPAIPTLLECVVRRELERCSSDEGISKGLFCACVEGLLSSDNFFTSHHFDEMDAILRCIIGKIGDSFDYLSVRWTPILNKLSRIYMRQWRGEALMSLHDELLAKIPALETKLPLSYLLRCVGSLVDAGATGEADDGGDDARIWRKIVAVTTLAVRLYGSCQSNLQSVWVIFFKGAITLKPQSMVYIRVVEAYHVCASLGHPVIVDKSAFSQVVRLLVSVVGVRSLKETATAVSEFYRFLKEHPSINFLWVIDSLIPIMSEIWKAHGELGCSIVQNITANLQADYFPSRCLSGIRLGDNPMVRRLLEDFKVMERSQFWWRCGCGTQLPSCAQRCLTCLRQGNISWTCGVCGARHSGRVVETVCNCGSPHPRMREAELMDVGVCEGCGEILPPTGECGKCGEIDREKQATRECPSCGCLYSKQALCCPTCYAANEAKSSLLWHCDACGEFNHSAWSKCQHCPGKRKVGCIVTPLQPWVCGCGGRNHPCRTSCESCSLLHRGAYTCACCSIVSTCQKAIEVPLHNSKLRLIVCERCGNVHPRDCNVLCSPFLPRHCHRCGVGYTRESMLSEECCNVCHTRLCYDELRPFCCSHCGQKPAQIGFQCTSCRAPREDVAAADVYVWRCLRETTPATAVTGTHVCGQWNYSWSDHCISCREARARSQYECRARFLPWVCASCGSDNLPTDVLLCPNCENGLQMAPECSVCGLPHLSLDCTVKEDI
ncbi:uncharacterized protein TEOVI_000722600 [Trypanosoma equiperdum]|uniref:RanBP2-type domain-containing protein n=2 Tax=Trypanozoon TaxID=39700 RepID=Q389A9_TRYB2|nr:hypothetical protein, conserved [Trypanosoma brucei brucei TREU927]EAN78611.1 hypothetical protein, conserved [Trypanosoma brucei brucei TREU927]SCU65041.1 hypothetical protein, conserved [Trypanosoma equiperdum]